MKSALKLVLTLVLAPFFVGLAIELAKPALPATLPAAMQALAMLTEWSGFPWIFAGAGGMLIGLWLERFASAFDARHPMTRKARLILLADESKRVGALCRAAASGEMGSERSEANLALTEAILLQEKLRRADVSFPTLSSSLKLKQGLETFGNIYGAIEPALRQGAVDLARSMATDIAVTAPAPRMP